MKRTCPNCKNQFGTSKVINGIRRCRYCGAKLHYPGGTFKGETMLHEEREFAVKIINSLEQVISARDGTNFFFDGKAMPAELHFVYGLIIRSRKFLYAQGNSLGWTPGQFAMDIFTAFMGKDWWRQHIRSFRMLGKHVSSVANEVYSTRKRETSQEEAIQSSVGDYRMPEGVAWASQ